MKNKLAGVIPTEIGQMTKLTTGGNGLFWSNKLTGTIPTELGMLGKMSDEFGLAANSFSSTIPTQLGQLVKMSTFFYLNDNSLSSTVPTQLGRLEKMKYGFWLKSNKLCSDVPTEVQALSSGVTDWFVTTSNSLGTDCGYTWPQLPAALPTSTTAVDYGGQSFTGTIPTQWGLLTGLTALACGESREGPNGTMRARAVGAQY